MMEKKYLSILLLLLLSQVTLDAQDIEISAVQFPSTLRSSAANDITQDRLGNIWMSTTSQGLIKYNGQNFNLFRTERNNPNSLVSDRLECVYADRKGNIWIGSFSNGLSKYEPALERFTNFVHDENDPTSIRSNAIRTFAEDESGGIWIGTAQGLDYWNPKAQSFEHQFEDSPDALTLGREHVRVLFIDKSGIIWAGTSSPFFGEQSKGGLFRIDPDTRSVKRYTHDDDPQSLVNNCVTAIFEDSRNTFWVGTAEDGLHTMDRNTGQFQRHTYDPSNPQKLSRPAFRSLQYAMDHIRFFEEDIYGRIWIGTMNNGINLYDPDENSIVHLHQERTDQYRLPQNDVWASLKTQDNLLWITGWSPSTLEEILFRIDLDPVRLNFIEMPAAVYSFAEDSAGYIYMGQEDFLFKLKADGELVDGIDLTNQSPIRPYYINLDSRSNLWISTNKGLLFYNPVSREYQLFPLLDTELTIGEPLEIYQTDEISPDSILVGTSNGLYLFDFKTKEFIRIPFELENRNERSLLNISAVFVDSRQNIWIGLDLYGLKKLARDLNSYKNYDFLENVQDRPNVIHEDFNGDLYVGNWRAGLRKYDYELDTFTLVTERNGRLKSETYVNDIISISDSVLLVQTSQGMLQLDLAANLAHAVELEEIDRYEITSWRILLSSSNEFYVGTSNGYLRFHPEEFERKSKYRPIPTISKVLVDDKNIALQAISAGESYDLNYSQNDISFTISYVNFLSDFRAQDLEYILENHDRNWRQGQNEDEIYYYSLSPGSYTFRVRTMADGSEDSIALVISPPWWRTWWAYALYAFILAFLGWRVHLFQKARVIRAERERVREKEVEHAREIEKAYNQLRATQTQLIHAEKMASLGELTAGIAHEIQNPLNFVNNFSEVSTELLDDIEEEFSKGDHQAAVELGKNLRQNLEKITHHGERASAIIKSMLLHSRADSGKREIVDINALADEYLRLAYHGMRAKDKSFNVSMKTDFDSSLEKIEMVPQEIGRVLLNLITNAFHAIAERKKNGENGYAPEVSVATRKTKNFVEISVKDNGNGVPEHLIDKIFQPFFTTKPTGEGTGLGLSLSYDILKAHGGDIKIKTENREGTEFTIQLPY